MEKGLQEEKIARIGEFRTDPAFTSRERLALEFAEAMALNHQSLGDAEVLELGMAIGQYIGFGRLLMVLDLERPVCDI